MRCQGIVKQGKRKGEQCLKSAIDGREYCRSHGGTNLAGPDHPNWKHGGYSKVAPKRLVETYERVVEESADERNELIHEIALIEARIEDLVKRADSGESGWAWKELRRKVRGLKNAEDDDDYARRLQEIFSLIEGGAYDFMVWEEVDRTIGRKTRLVESERKRAIENQEMMHREQVMAMVGSWSAIVRRVVEARVPDTIIADAILSDISRTLEGRPAGSVEAISPN